MSHLPFFLRPIGKSRKMNPSKFALLLKKTSLEAYIWIVALMALALVNPGEGHLTVCPIANVGFDWCPGCGLGRSISMIFRGELLHSFEMHPLGIPTLLVLSYRIASLFMLTIKNLQENESNV